MVTAAVMRRKGAGCEGVVCEHTLGEQPLHLYGYFWAKPDAAAAQPDGDDEDDAEAEDMCGKFSVVLTGTVVFKHQKPVKWLFTSKQEKGKILCRSKKNLLPGLILQEFLAPKLSTRGAKRDDTSGLVLVTFAYTERLSTTGELQLIVGHLDKAGLTVLLLHRDKPALSVLQRLIPTKSGYNHTIQSVFTQENCLIRKCVGPNLIADDNVSIPQRTITFEADENEIRARDVADKGLRQRIEKIHAEINSHLEKIVGKEIVRNVAYFKVGADDRIYLLWSTMISFESQRKSFAKNYKLSVSAHDRLRNSIQTEERNRSNKALGLSSQLKCCPACDQMLPRDQVDFLATYKSIIRHSESESRLPQQPEAERRIPSAIERVCGLSKMDRYEQLKQEPAFLYQTAALCHNCSQMLNPRQLEAPSKKGTQSRQEEKAATEASKPLDKKSAHSLFWGRVEREAKAKTFDAPKARPFSVGIPRIRFQRDAAKSAHSSKQYHRHLSQLFPVLHRSKAAPQADSMIQDCVDSLVQHLQRQYHRPSIRFALAQCNIFPVGSIVPVTTLHWICGADLLRSTSRYWTELCKSRGETPDQATIDIDALDDILANSAASKAPLSSDAKQSGRKNALLDSGATSSGTTTKIAEMIHSIPTRPSRPRSSSVLPTTSRFSSLSNRKVSKSIESEVDTAQARMIDMADAKIVSEESQQVVAIDGVKYPVGVNACSGVGNDSQYSLHLSAAAMESTQTSASMDLTLQPNEILALLLDEQDPAAILSSGKDALIRTVLTHLRVKDGRLTVAKKTPVVKKPCNEIASTELSAEELLVLEETLMKFS